ncbi:MAG: fibronectin type III domain-containing protein [Candidatus Muiribacteriota bacterium]
MKFNKNYLYIFFLIKLLVLLVACTGSSSPSKTVSEETGKDIRHGIKVNISGYINNYHSISKIQFHTENNLLEEKHINSNSYSGINLEFFPFYMKILTENDEKIIIKLRHGSWQETNGGEYYLKQKIDFNSPLKYSSLEIHKEADKLKRRVVLARKTDESINYYTDDFKYISNVDNSNEPFIFLRLDKEYSLLSDYTFSSLQNLITENPGSIFESLDALNKNEEEILSFEIPDELEKKDESQKIDTPGKITNIEVKNKSSNSFEIIWPELKNAEYYAVYINDELKKNYIFNNKFIANNLATADRYKVQVAGVNFRGTGELSEALIIDTLEDSDETKILDFIEISRYEAVIPVSNSFNLNRIDVVANYRDGRREKVGNVLWHIINGDGYIDDNIFYSPEEDGITHLRCTHKRAGETSFAFFEIEYLRSFADVKKLRFNIEETQLQVGETFNFEEVEVEIVFEDDIAFILDNVEWEFLTPEKGNFKQNIFRAESPTGKAVFRTYYAHNEKTIHKDFIIDLIPTETGISISPEYVLVNVGNQFDLSEIKVYLEFDDGEVQEVNDNYSWEVIEGNGEVSGNLFTAPNSAGTTLVKCVYSGHTEEFEALLTITNERSLDAITFSDNDILINTNTIYKLDENIDIIATYDDGFYEIIDFDLSEWEKISGRGVLNDEEYKFNSGNIQGEAELRASYTEDDITRTNDFNIIIGEIPLAPSGLQAKNISTNSFEFSWQNVFHADSYNIYLDNSLIAENITQTSFNVSNVESGSNYTVNVSSQNIAGESLLSDNLTITTVPGTPESFEADDISPTSMNLNWDSVQGASSYNVYVNGNIRASEIKSTSYFLSGGLAPGTSYLIQVSARNISGEGLKSEGRMFKTSLQAPTGLNIGSPTDNSFTFAWNPVSGADYYFIYKNGDHIAQTTELEYMVTDLDSNTSYEMSVAAVRNTLEGVRSSELTGTTSP